MPSPTDSPAALTRKLAREVWTKGAVDVVDEWYSEHLTGGIIGHYEFAGRDDYKRWVAESNRAFSDLEIQLEWCYETDDLACGKWTASATHDGKLVLFDIATIPPTNTQVEYSGLFIGRFHNGRVIEEWHASDFITLFMQLRE